MSEPADDKRTSSEAGAKSPSDTAVAKKVPARRKTTSPRSRGSKDDLLSSYLAEVRRYPIMNVEEEKEVALQYYEYGDQEAANKLITSNLRLVIKIAFQYHRQWANVLDLIQEGNVGLVEALSRYDPYREIRFSSYAQYWIRAMILRFLLDNFRLVRLGSTRAGRKLFFQLQKERDRLVSEGIDPTEATLAERLGVAPKEIRAVDQHMRAPALSLHAPATGDEQGRTLSEVVPESVPNDPENNAARSELGGLVKGLLDNFATDLTNERERDIWHSRLVATDPESLSTLGERYGVSKERIRQVEARMKKRLRTYLEAELGEEVDFEFQVPED